MIRTTLSGMTSVVAVLMLSGPLMAQAPRITPSQSSWDIGTVWHGEKRTMKWQLRNEGDGELELLDLISSCGCTAVSRPDPLVPPGGQVELDIQFDSTGKFGRVTSTITLVSSDPVNPRLVLAIQADVKKSVTMEPVGGVVFRATELSEGTVSSVKLQNREDKPLKLRIESVQPESFAAEVKEITPGQEYEIIVRIRSALRETTRGQVTVVTEHEREPRITIPILATLVRRIELQPPALFVSKSLSRESQRRVQVHSFGEKPVAITRVECLGGKVVAREITNPRPPTGSMAKLNPAPISEVTVTLGLPPGHEIPEEGLTVRLHTDDPEVPYLEVYVTNDSAVHKEKMSMAGRRG